MKYYVHVIFVLALVVSCEKKDLRQYSDYKPHEIIHVDLDKVNNDISDLISCVDLIPFEIVESFIVQSMAQMIVSDERIYMSGGRNQYKFACYSIDGKHIYTINRRGRGHGEYIEPSNFSVMSDGTLAVYDQATGNLLHYAPDGKFHYSKKMPCFGDDVAYVNDSIIIAYARLQSLFESDKRAVKIIDGRDNKIIASYLPLPDWERKTALDSPIGSNFFYCNNSPKLALQWCPEIFSVGTDSLYCAYHIDYGKHAFPEAVLKENAYEMDPVVLLKSAKDGDWVMAMDFFQENTGYLFFQTMKDYKLYFTLYDKRSKKAYSSLTDDLSWEWKLIWKPFMCSDGNRFFSLVSVSQLEQLDLLKNVGELKDPKIIDLHEQYVSYKKDAGVKFDDEDVLLVSFEMN